MSLIVTLADRQLAAYNAANLDAFVACYHADVSVLKDMNETIRGTTLFRERYAPLFEKWRFGASVPQRLHLGDHCVDYESWWRIDPETQERSEGLILVRYQLRDGLIGTAQFFS